MNCLLEKTLSDKATPFLLDFVVWLLNRSKKDNIKKLYFLSRDGQILYEITRSLAEYTETPELKYLYGSRQAFYLPAIEYISPNQKLEWLTNKAFSQTIYDFCQRLTIEYSSIDHILADYDLNYINPSKELSKFELTNFRRMLLDKRMDKLIIERSHHSRMLTIKYFKQEGLFENDAWAVVDTGWSLRSQFSIQTILKNGGYKHKISGYYVGIIKDHIVPELAGNYSAFVTEENGFVYGSTPYQWLFKQSNMIMLEDIFMPANHGGVLGYIDDNSKIAPLLESYTTKEIDYFDNLQKIILDSAKEIYSQYNVDTRNALKNFENLGNFFTHPTKKEALSVADLFVNVEQTHDPRHQVKVAGPLCAYDIFSMAFAEIINKKYVKKNIWQNGSIALSPPYIKILFKTLLWAKAYYIRVLNLFT